MANIVQNAQPGRFQTGTGLLGPLNLAPTGLFQEIQIQYLLQLAVDKL